MQGDFVPVLCLIVEGGKWRVAVAPDHCRCPWAIKLQIAKLQRDSKTELCLACDFTQNPPAGILSATESTSTKSAADWGFHCNGAIPSLLVQLQLELQRVEQSNRA